MEEPRGEPGFDAGSNEEDVELYLLKWNSHQHHFANRFSELLDEDDISFADVTLACEGNFLQAHRLVLSVCSPFFKNLFKINSAEKGPATIVLANIRYTDLENILHFIYRGQVNVRKEDLNKFLETGEQLQIDGLMGQHGQKQQTPFKRRFSEGGQLFSRSNQHQHQQNHSHGLAKQAQNAKVVTGNSNSNRLPAVSTPHSNHTNHIENAVKRPRISPTSAVQQESVSVANPPSRRLSTSAVAPLSNSNAPPSQHLKKNHKESLEVNDTSRIKILSVASINTQAAAALPPAEFDGESNDVFEILDYEDEDRPENDIEIPEDLVGSYVDGDDDRLQYGYHQSSSFARSSVNSSQSLSQQMHVGGNVQARYPSIIDGVHFELISADERKVAAQCKLCPGDKVIRGSGLTSSNFISHLRAFHKPELESWREKRKTESRRRMD